MVLLSAMVIGGVAYATSQRDREPPFDTEGKSSLNLLPLETDLSFLEPPVSTIAFLDGNADDIATYLRDRIDQIIKANPWLGGWLHRTGGVTRLWYDPEGEDLAPGIFRAFEADTFGLSRDTPYAEYGNLAEEGGGDIQVKKNADLIDKNEPVWRVSLIPDVDQPAERFALVVSMSHVCGDAHTYCKIMQMLNVGSPIISLNAERNFEFVDAAEKMMGKQEASYIKRVTSDPLYKDVKIGKASRHIFLFSDDWLRQQRCLYSGNVNTKMQGWLTKAKSKKAEAAPEKVCWGYIQPRRPQSAVADASEVEPVNFLARLRRSMLPSSAVPFPVRVTNNALIVSAFWRTVNVNVGLMVYNFRNRLIDLTDDDAGNYALTIPYTPEDYKTPLLIQKSLLNARRVGADRLWKPTKLPKFSLTGFTSAVVTNWASFGRTELTLDGSVTQIIQLPLYSAEETSVIPSTLSYLIIFNAGPGEKLGAILVAPESVMNKVDASGMVGKTVAKF